MNYDNFLFVIFAELKLHDLIIYFFHLRRPFHLSESSRAPGEQQDTVPFAKYPKITFFKETADKSENVLCMYLNKQNEPKVCSELFNCLPPLFIKLNRMFSSQHIHIFILSNVLERCMCFTIHINKNIKTNFCTGFET